ncbi:NAD-dependent epimerase/dehydratase family protein [Ectobacillus ponti]|uniref:NAD(P)-dependent oxidoreductase n=1 Tax=Ectobacillus ponti TaxID=2961894 RepID=A0AA41X8G6_9BACI|nr:NAD(P)-dependent oxidoreductase [Ectobacillus ponti]MCP8968295.1 NAD(P)-dependent oxidoreductase [Ectobacillus ponti]
MTNRAIVAGALTFVGYCLVERLLEEGNEVLGLDFEEIAGMSAVSEEKLLGVGRNAAFTYRSFQESYIEEMRRHGGQMVYMCAAEPNQRSVAAGQRVERLLRQLIDFCKTHTKKLVLLSSVEAQREAATENGRFFYSLEQQVEQELQHYGILQMPVVYGPWQPAFMAYHRLLSGGNADHREQGSDAVYVDDAAACLHEMGTGSLEGLYHLSSGKPQQWEAGVRLLGGTVPPGEKHGRRAGARVYPYQPRTALEEGLRRQRLHLQQYQHLYERMP